MNPGPNFTPGVDVLDVLGPVLTLLLLAAVVVFGVLVLRRLGAIQRRLDPAARDATAPRIDNPAVPQQSGVSTTPSADWQQRAVRDEPATA